MLRNRLKLPRGSLAFIVGQNAEQWILMNVLHDLAEGVAVVAESARSAVIRSTPQSMDRVLISCLDRNHGTMNLLRITTRMKRIDDQELLDVAASLVSLYRAAE